jgi:hypothetical protein
MASLIPLLLSIAPYAYQSQQPELFANLIYLKPSIDQRPEAAVIRGPQRSPSKRAGAS